MIHTDDVRCASGDLLLDVHLPSAAFSLWLRSFDCASNRRLGHDVVSIRKKGSWVCSNAAVSTEATQWTIVGNAITKSCQKSSTGFSLLWLVLIFGDFVVHKAIH